MLPTWEAVGPLVFKQPLPVSKHHLPKSQQQSHTPASNCWNPAVSRFRKFLMPPTGWMAHQQHALPENNCVLFMFKLQAFDSFSRLDSKLLTMWNYSYVQSLWPSIKPATAFRAKVKWILKIQLQGTIVNTGPYIFHKETAVIVIKYLNHYNGKILARDKINEPGYLLAQRALLQIISVWYSSTSLGFQHLGDEGRKIMNSKETWAKYWDFVSRNKEDY